MTRISHNQSTISVPVLNVYIFSHVLGTLETDLFQRETKFIYARSEM